MAEAAKAPYAAEVEAGKSLKKTTTKETDASDVAKTMYALGSDKTKEGLKHVDAPKEYQMDKDAYVAAVQAEKEAAKE